MTAIPITNIPTGLTSDYHFVSIRGVKGYIPLNTPIRTDVSHVWLNEDEIEICNNCGAEVYDIVDAGLETEHEMKREFTPAQANGPVMEIKVDDTTKEKIRKAQIEEAIERAKIHPALISGSSFSYGPYSIAKDKEDPVKYPDAQNVGSSFGTGSSNNDKKPASESAISPGSAGFRSAGDGDHPRAPKNTKPIPPEFQTNKKKKDENSENKSNDNSENTSDSSEN